MTLHLIRAQTRDLAPVRTFSKKKVEVSDGSAGNQKSYWRSSALLLG